MTTTMDDDQPRLRGPARVREMLRRFRREQDDPAPFYTMLAGETVDRLERRHGPVAGTTVVDLASGPGFYTDAFRAHGASVIPLEHSLDELQLSGEPPAGAVIGDAEQLPLPDGSVDAVFCSNMLEHTPDTAAVVRELARVLRVGGWAYVSWTNWYSPWGGHEMTPYHYLGPRLGPRLYEKRHGVPKNRFGEGLFPVHIGPTLRLVRSRSDLRIDRAEPRYWTWASFLTKVPGAREVLCWNCVIHITKIDVTKVDHG
ncbi:MAG: class I SAM-dependent methyltransferase [Acidimicrobiia bacterium]